MPDAKGMVFDIQRYSIHDGPGIRTVVFLKGCLLSCKWCANPESQNRCSELYYIRSKCISCGLCVAACPKNAIRADKASGGIAIDRNACDRCFACTGACPSMALMKKGVLMSAGEVLEEAVKDRIFFEKSGGGVTLSGGEPLFQYEFALSLLKSLKDKRIHTAVETTGLLEWEAFKEALFFIDTVLYDFKHADAQRHKEGTGVSNDIIKGNLEKLLSCKKDVTVRIPVIPGYNDDVNSIEGIASFLAGIHVKKAELMRFHQLGAMKYASLGAAYSLRELAPMDDDTFENIKKAYCKNGLAII